MGVDMGILGAVTKGRLDILVTPQLRLATATDVSHWGPVAVTGALRDGYISRDVATSYRDSRFRSDALAPLLYTM